MGLWLDVASTEKINTSIGSTVDEEKVRSILKDSFTDKLLERSIDNSIYCMGISHIPTKYKKMSSGDEVLITTTGSKNFDYYAQIIAKAHSIALVEKLWPFQKGTNICYIYFLTNVKKIELSRKDVLWELGEKRTSIHEIISIDSNTYERYGRVCEKHKLETKIINFDPILEASDADTSSVNQYPLQCGDIVFIKGDTPLSKFSLILQKTKSFRFKNKNKSIVEYSHVALGVGRGIVVEATKKRSDDIRFETYNELLKTRALQFEVYRNKNLDSAVQDSIVKKAEYYYGQDYASLMKNIVLFFYQKISSYIPWIKDRNVSHPFRSYCSELVINILHESGLPEADLPIPNNIKANNSTPQDIKTFVENSDRWENVTEQIKKSIATPDKQTDERMKDYLKTLCNPSAQENTQDQIREWINTYQTASNVPVYERLKIENRLKNRKVSIQQYKEYTKFFKGTT